VTCLLLWRAHRWQLGHLWCGRSTRRCWGHCRALQMLVESLRSKLRRMTTEYPSLLQQGLQRRAVGLETSCSKLVSQAHPADAHIQSEAVGTVPPGTSRMTDAPHTCGTCSSRYCHMDTDILWRQMAHRVSLCCSCRWSDNKGTGTGMRQISSETAAVMTRSIQ